MKRKIPDNIILGDNQFFGVNHMSQEKGHESELKFKDISKIQETLHAALDYGVTGVMFSTHPLIYQITDMMRSDKRICKQMGIYVNMPYIMKYVRMLSEMGMFNTIKTTLTGNKGWKKLKFLLRSTGSLLSGNYKNLVHRLIEAELSPFYKLQIKSVFLHNAICDILLGYKLTSLLFDYNYYVSEKLKLVPAYGTLNYPKFSQLLGDSGIKQPIIMTSINKKGFLMNPNREAVEKSIKQQEDHILAMATLASGRLEPEEAYKYLFSLPNIESVVVGLSSKRHAEETFSILSHYFNNI